MSAVPFERRAVASLASLYAFRMLGLFMVLPVLSLYGEVYDGSSPLMLGVALGAYGFTQAILQIPFGMWSDRWGRKPVIVVGLLLFALGSVVAAQASTVYELIIGRCLQGGGAIASAIMALVADLTSDENRTKAMAAIGASIGLSFSVALVLGPVISAGYGLSGIFWLTAVLALVGIVILLRWVPTPVITQARSHRDAGAVPELLGRTLRNRELMRLNVGVGVLHCVLMATFVVMPLILEQQLGISREQHWQLYLPMLVLAFIAMVPFMIVAEKRRKIKPVFLGAVGLLGAMELVMAASLDASLVFLAGLFLFFTAFNLLEATLPSLMSKAAPAGSKGTASGIYSTSQFMGAFIGGVGGGWLLQEHGVGAVFACSTVMIAIWLAVAMTMSTPRFLTSVQVPLEGQDPAAAEARLGALPGVAEVVIIAEEQAAYLKVDNKLFDRQALKSS
ncbi:MFS transporter [Maricurvus nonylphenolicus]|uniref:MFS transporter n=1 Tax=Maricurvus nonylphenolicus TaxID=1008307 RepID=UPI0036F289DC